MNYRPPLRFLGRLLLILAGAQLVPCGVSLLYGESGAAGAFVASAALTAAVASVLMLVGRGSGELYRREGILIVVGVGSSPRSSGRCLMS